MTKVAGVKFKDDGKVYYFNPSEIQLEINDRVIVETVRGIECGVIACPVREIEENELVKPLKPILRKADFEDIRIFEENKRKELEAFDIAVERISAHGLEMKLLNVEYTFDRAKVIFNFTADGRVDFRELVKDLASIFRTRIELRQIGVRDRARTLGGLGACGRPFCCKTFLNDFIPVSIKMAKEQGLSLNPVKISGTCGRLMCCLKYEQDTYEHLLKITPKPGALVDTKQGKGKVTEMSLLTGRVKVQLDNNPDGLPVQFSIDEIKVIHDGRLKIDKEEMDALKSIE